MVWLQCENAGVIFQKGLLFYGLRGGDASFFFSPNVVTKFFVRIRKSRSRDKAIFRLAQPQRVYIVYVFLTCFYYLC